MRDILIFCIIFGLVPMMIMRPANGALVFMWISIMNPHRLTYGAAHDFPFAALVAGITLISVCLTREERRYPLQPATVLLLMFFMWMTFTTFFALLPQLAWAEWNRVSKTLFMVMVTILVVNTEKDLKRMVWILGLSLGFFGLKGGIFTVMSGGSYRVWGPDGSYIAENNSLALALVMAVPIIWYLKLQSQNKWVQRGLLAVAVFTVISAAGSYSRGAMVGMAAMLALLWLKSRTKVSTGLVILLLVPVVLLTMPDQWWERMMTVGEYQKDGSALGRINAWHFAINIASKNFLGGGFMAFDPILFFTYAPDPQNHHAAHSIYFQVLGEHGYFGLLLFLGLLAATWRLATNIMKTVRNHPDLKWAADLAAMSQVSMVGYMVGGAFLSLAYYDYFYYVLAALVVTQKIIVKRQVPNVQKTGFAKNNNLRNSVGQRAALIKPGAEPARNTNMQSGKIARRTLKSENASA